MRDVCAAVGETAWAMLVARLARPIDGDDLAEVIELLEPLTTPGALDSYPSTAAIEILALPWAPPPAAGVEAQRAIAAAVLDHEAVLSLHSFQVGTSADPETDEWSHGLPPLRAELDFPVDGRDSAIEDFDWYDFGVAVKLGERLAGIEVALWGFMNLWLAPIAGCFRNADVTFDPVHHAAHFWLDRNAAPLSDEQQVHFLQWVIGELASVVAIAHATFEPATMAQKYAELVGDEPVTFVLAGNPLRPIHDDGGMAAVEAWMGTQELWADAEVAAMLREIAVGVLLAGTDEVEDGEVDPARAAAALPVIARALELSPGDDEIQLTHGMAHIDAGEIAQVVDRLEGFETGTRLRLLNRLGEVGSARFADALERVLGAPLPDRLLGSHTDGAITSFGDQSPEVFGQLVGHVVERAPDAFARVLAALPADRDALAAIAWSLYSDGRKAECLAVYRRLIEIPPPLPDSDAVDYARTLNNGTAIATLEGDTELAARIAGIAVPFGRINPFIFHSAACAHVGVGDLERGWELVVEAVEHDYKYLAPEVTEGGSSYVETDEYLGELLDQHRFADLFARWRRYRPPFVAGTEAMSDDPGAAIALLEEACAGDSPLRRMALINLGLAHHGAGDHAAMWEISIEGHRAYPDDGDLFANLVGAARELGRFAELAPIVRDGHRALRPEARNIQNVTFALNEAGDHHGSVEALDGWIEAHGPLPQLAMGNAVNAYAKTGRPEDAVRWARELVTRAGDATAFWFLSYALMISGDIDGAVAAARAVAEIDADTFAQLRADADMAPLADRLDELAG